MSTAVTTITPNRIRIRYTKAEAAQMLSISERSLDRLRADGKIIGRHDGGRIYFDHGELASYALSCTPEGD
jgi:hypothetical protein